MTAIVSEAKVGLHYSVSAVLWRARVCFFAWVGNNQFHTYHHVCVTVLMFENTPLVQHSDMSPLCCGVIKS